MRLVELANESENIMDKDVLKLQRNLMLKKYFRLMAVQRVITNKGGETKGVDGYLIKTDKEK